MSVVVTKRSRFQIQVNRLKQRGITKLFGNTWLNQLALADYELLEKDETSFLILPSGLIPSNQRWDYLKSLCPNLRRKKDNRRKVRKHLYRAELPTRAQIIEDVSYDIWSETAVSATNDWPKLRRELLTAGRSGLTMEELILSLFYDPNRCDIMLGLGSVTKDRLVPCLEPIFRQFSGHWQLALHRLDGLIGPEGIYPLKGAFRVVAPTAKRFTPVSVSA